MASSRSAAAAASSLQGTPRRGRLTPRPLAPPPHPPRPRHRLGIAPAGPFGASYYSFVPHPGFRFVVLDSYDLSLLDAAQGRDHPLRKRAEEIMRVNPNANK
jgi:hypothetical protein